MDCDSITNSLSVTSTTLPNRAAQFDKSAISCGAIHEAKVVGWTGALSSLYRYSIDLINVFHGVHEITIRNVTNKEKDRWTNVGLFFFVIWYELIQFYSLPITFCFALGLSITRWSGQSKLTTAGHYCTATRLIMEVFGSLIKLRAQKNGATRSTSGHHTANGCRTTVAMYPSLRRPGQEVSGKLGKVNMLWFNTGIESLEAVIIFSTVILHGLTDLHVVSLIYGYTVHSTNLDTTLVIETKWF